MSPYEFLTIALASFFSRRHPKLFKNLRRAWPRVITAASSSLAIE